MSDLFPNSERWMYLDTSIPYPIHEAYRNQLIGIILNDGRIKVYDGENGMEPTNDYSDKEVLAWDRDSSLANLLKGKFPQIKDVRVGDL